MNFNEQMINDILKDHSGEVLLLALMSLVLFTLMVALPQLLRANQRKHELIHEQRMKSLEKGLPLPMEDETARLGGRTALLVPMVVMISAATVTSFLVVYKSESLFPVGLSIWVVGGVVSLAAITGGLALLGRLGRFEVDEKDEEEEPQERSYMN